MYYCSNPHYSASPYNIFYCWMGRPTWAPNTRPVLANLCLRRCAGIVVLIYFVCMGFWCIMHCGQWRKVACNVDVSPKSRCLDYHFRLFRRHTEPELSQLCAKIQKGAPFTVLHLKHVRIPRHSLARGKTRVRLGLHSDVPNTTSLATSPSLSFVLHCP